MPIFDGIMPIAPKTHIVAILLADGVVAPDAAIPCETFSRTVQKDGACTYEVKVCSEEQTVESAFFKIEAPFTLSLLKRADTIIVPGIENVGRDVSPAVLKALRQAHKRGARIASICTGAFILAACGVLNGLQATTHWAFASQLTEQYPAINVDPNVLYTDNGQILTSAGAMAGLDLCLHMIRRDFGAEIAAQTARLSVAPLEREGGQRQFIHHELPDGKNRSLSPLLEWIDNNLGSDLTIARLSGEASVSPRTLHRRFIEQVSLPPLSWVLHRRVRYAQRLLEMGTLNIEQIAAEAGFGSSANFRELFRRIVGKSPTAYRKLFQRLYQE